MRFVKLLVESFQAIQYAELELGPGLNILYGPNDLGKSTLVEAIRAALLLAPGSADALGFGSWYADGTPRVGLTFAADDEQFWTVKKSFGATASACAAELHHSKDGSGFTLDCKGRQVEEQVRALLRWGIPAPGGKGAPRGLPTSFLANALLGSQTAVEEILNESLEMDGEESGRARLSSALASLAQDPVFKRVLEVAQAQVDQCFTATGKRKRGKSSRFAGASDKVARLREAEDALAKSVSESEAVEGTCASLRSKLDSARDRALHLSVQLDELRQRIQATQRRREAAERLDLAEREVNRIDTHIAGMALVAQAIEDLTVKVATQEEIVAEALNEVAAADMASRAADDALRIATTSDGEGQRERRHARIAQEQAELREKKLSLEGRVASLSALLDARGAEERAAGLATAASAAAERLATQANEAAARTKAADAAAELACAVIAYGRWSDASVAAQRAADAAVAAEASRAEAEQRDLAASRLEAEARAISEDAAAAQVSLPSAEQVTNLESLEYRGRLADAALGGGLRVAIRPHRAMRVETVIDQVAHAPDAESATERVFEGERSVRVVLADLAEIEILAGAAEKLQTAEELHRRWDVEAVPLLARAGSTSLADVKLKLAALAERMSMAKELQRRAGEVRAEAAQLRERASLQEATATTGAATHVDLAARKEAIGPIDETLLQAEYTKLASPWEHAAEKRHKHAVEVAKVARKECDDLDQRYKIALVELKHAESERLRCAHVAASASVGDGEPSEMLTALRAAIAAVEAAATQLAIELSGLAKLATEQVARAQQAVVTAKARCTAAKVAHAATVDVLEVDKAALNARKGELVALRSQFSQMDRHEAESVRAQRRAELDALPVVATVAVGDEDAAKAALAAAEADVGNLAADLHKNEGALSQVGGASVREEVARVQEALVLAKEEEQELELDADAWKLLAETLRVVENEEGAHLGKALAVPVAERFEHLTGGRYSKVRLDAKLKTESVEAARAVNGAGVLDALSVGTRDQLATIVRLTIAEQLKSAIVLDDHLVHTDPTRLAWFRQVLMRAALTTQVVVFTCRPEDYLLPSEQPQELPMRDLGAGALRAIDLGRVVKRLDGAPPRGPLPTEGREVVAATSLLTGGG